MNRAGPVVAGTKFAVPRIPNASIERTRLLDRLDGSANCRLSILVAAAGSGKTALLADWVSSRGGQAAWLSCDSVDADPGLFWEDVIGAVHAAWSPAGLTGMEVVGKGEPVVDRVVRLANDLAAIDARGVIVLDDYHMARTDAATMVAFVAALPPTVRLVLGTRVAPTFPLGRLRVQGNLLELRQSELNFTLEETRAVLANLGVELDAAELKALDFLVEGWPAGVHLAGLALRATSNRAGLLRNLAESDHDVADFLTSEVIDIQPAGVQQFITATAELELFDAALCDEVLGRSDSAAMLEQVLARSLFLTRVDAAGVWFRYHHLFGAFLRARLRATQPGRAAELHDAAARAYVARQDLMSAVRHHVAAGDLPSAGRLLRESVLSDLSVADQAVATTAARACLARVDDASIEGSATDILDCVAALTMAGAVQEAEPWLRIVTAAEARLEMRARCQLHTVRALHLFNLGDPAAALEHARTAGAIASADPDAAYAPSLLAVLTARLHLVFDQLDAARAALDGIPLTEQLHRSRGAVHLTGARALVEMYAGELGEADRLAAAALRTADDLGLEGTNDSRAYAQLTLAALAIERDDLDEADARLEQMMRIVEDGRRPALEAETRLHMAVLAAARGEVERALAHLDEARATQPHATAAVTGHIDQLELRIRLDLGDTERAQAASSRLPTSLQGQLLAARVHLRAGRHDQGGELLDRVEPSLTTRRFEVEHGLLRAMCLAARHDDDALPALGSALDLARPAQFVRTIIGEGPAMWALLEALPTHGALTAYVGRLLAAARRVLPAAAAPERSSLVDPLTEREMAVLRYLASRLDTSGIAEAMYLSANTVRSHVKSIYRKLGVSSRADAVAQGRRLGLFGPSLLT